MRPVVERIKEGLEGPAESSLIQRQDKACRTCRIDNTLERMRPGEKEIPWEIE